MADCLLSEENFKVNSVLFINVDIVILRQLRTFSTRTL